MSCISKSQKASICYQNNTKSKSGKCQVSNLKLQTNLHQPIIIGSLWVLIARIADRHWSLVVSISRIADRLIWLFATPARISDRFGWLFVLISTIVDRQGSLFVSMTRITDSLFLGYFWRLPGLLTASLVCADSQYPYHLTNSILHQLLN